MEAGKIYVLMGVCGSGKTTIGKRLAEHWQIPFYDADDFHTLANIQKMESGEPLTDQDRGPWLKLLAQRLRDWSKDEGAVLACSALKAAYRTQLEQYTTPRWIYLKGTPQLIEERLRAREDHYMNSALLASQFAILEEPQNTLVIDIAPPVDQIVDQIIQQTKMMP